MDWRNRRVTPAGKRLLDNVLASVLACGAFLVAWGLWGLILAQTEENRAPASDRVAVGEQVAGDDLGHGQRSGPSPDSREFSGEQRVRIRKLEERITCACPKENWTKTLYHCPDGCADPQKSQIRAAIREGKSDSEILEQQKQRYGPKALAQPGWGGGGKWTYLLPGGICVAAIAVTLAVLSILVRRSGAEGEADHPEGERASDAELAALEQELSELDD